MIKSGNCSLKRGRGSKTLARHHSRGFTLAELVVVMAILGVMLVAFAPVLTKKTLTPHTNNKITFDILPTHNGIYFGSIVDDKQVVIGDNKVPNGDDNINSKLFLMGRRYANPNDTSEHIMAPQIGFGVRDNLQINHSGRGATIYGGRLFVMPNYVSGATSTGSSAGVEWNNVILGGITDGTYNLGLNGTNPVLSGTTIIGMEAGNEQGIHNTIVGAEAGSNLKIQSGHTTSTIVANGGNSTLIGYQAGKGMTGTWQTVVGANSGKKAPNGTTILGSYSCDFSYELENNEPEHEGTICLGYMSGETPTSRIMYNASQYHPVSTQKNRAKNRIFIGSRDYDYTLKDVEDSDLRQAKIAQIFVGKKPLYDLISSYVEDMLPDIKRGLNGSATPPPFSPTSFEISDFRLKNVGKGFVGGIEELNKLKFYNFTFKNDKNKEPQVGVMAQDLQKVFPDAVKKGSDGYLRIRQDDMFYSALNAIKELFVKITENTNKINELVEENKELKLRNNELELRVQRLEELIVEQ